jgi:serine/threonine protein kinase
LLGIEALHDQDIVHRDIKSDNIFLDANMNAKVGDLGSMVRIDKLGRQ